MNGRSLSGHAGPPSRRNGAVDFLKTFAILGVLFIHASTSSYYQPLGSSPWLWGLFWGSISRASVPIFLICSGALLLDPQRDLPLKKLYGKNVLRILTALFFWAMVYKVFGLLRAHTLSSATLIQGIKEVLTFQHEFHFYYLHITLLVYALLPATRLIAAHADKKALEYLPGIWFLLGIVYPTVKPLWPFTLLNGIPAQWALNLTYASVGYGLLGWYLRQYAGRWKLWAALGALGFALTYGGTIGASLLDGALNVTPLNGNTVGVALMAAGICGAAFAGLRGRPPLPGSAWLSKASFCIYLVHVFFLYTLSDHGISALMFHPALAVPLTVALMLAGSLLVYLILRRIPVVRQWLI